MHCSLILCTDISTKEIPGTLLIILHSKVLTAIKTDILTYTHGQNVCTHMHTPHTPEKKRKKPFSLNFEEDNVLLPMEIYYFFLVAKQLILVILHHPSD